MSTLSHVLWQGFLKTRFLRRKKGKDMSILSHVSHVPSDSKPHCRPRQGRILQRKADSWLC